MLDLVLWIINQRRTAAALEFHGVANDLAAETGAAADAGDRDRRRDSQDRPRKFSVLISSQLQIRAVPKRHIDQEALIDSTGRCEEAVLAIAQSADAACGRNKGHVVAVIAARPAEVHTTPAVDVE